MNTRYSAAFFYCSVILLFAVIPISGCTPLTVDDGVVRIFCDGESVMETENGLKFLTDSTLFDHGQNRTELKAFSGNGSVLLTQGREFGMTHQLNDLQEGERLVVRVRRNSDKGIGSLVAAAKPIHLLYYSTSDPISSESKNNWDLLELRFDVPLGVDTVLFYLYNNGTDSAFFDDLEILRMPPRPNIPLGDLTHLQFQLDTSDVQKMAEMRAKAMLSGVISKKFKKEFDCELQKGEEHFPSEIRFKGDWTDHLKSSKWSYRVKLAGGKALDHKRTFSVQHPDTRNFLEEWFLHRLFKNEDILTTEYDFVTVAINGVNKGIHAREEHFEKQLLESQNRREGVILKLDESLFWKTQANADKVHWSAQNIRMISAASILPFKQKKTLSSESLAKQFETGRNQLFRLKSFDPSLGEYLDLEKFAKYYAIQIIANTVHGSRWHNQRWYANPVTTKLEPIAYDCVTSTETLDTSKSVFHFLEAKELDQDEFLSYIVYNDPAFCDLLLENLRRLTRKEHLDSLIRLIEPELNENLKLLKSEFPHYEFDVTEYYSFAKRVRRDLKDLEDWIETGKKFTVHSNGYPANVPPIVSECMVPEVFITGKNGQFKYEVVNHAPSELIIDGYTFDKKKDLQTLDVPISISSGASNKFTGPSKKKGVKEFFYHYAGSDSVHSVSPFSWSAPNIDSPKGRLTTLPEDHPAVASAENQTLILKSGDITIDELFIMKDGWNLEIPPGAKISFSDGAGLIVQGPVSALGTEDQPITVVGETKENHGFTILQANQKSELTNVSFENLNTLRLDGWVITGGVNFYEADVSIQSCQFNSNNCEDALNIIRSDFTVSNCEFNDVFGDAFDSDFCTGRLSGTTFNNIGNDGIDFSGSVVDVSKCDFIGIGDKAVSGGEQSTLIVADMNVNVAEIGIASKDMSLVKVSDSRVAKCKFGYVAYTKKPEYGGAHMVISNVSISDLKTEYDIELKSTLKLDGKLIKGSGYSKVDKY